MFCCVVIAVIPLLSILFEVIVEAHLQINLKFLTAKQLQAALDLQFKEH